MSPKIISAIVVVVLIVIIVVVVLLVRSSSSPSGCQSDSDCPDASAKLEADFCVGQRCVECKTISDCSHPATTGCNLSVGGACRGITCHNNTCSNDDFLQPSDTPYLGCYADSEDRALSRSLANPTTWNDCMQTARNAGAKYFALQYGEGAEHNKAQCLYGSENYAKYGEMPNDCTIQDDAGHVFGTAWRSAVYGTGY